MLKRNPAVFLFVLFFVALFFVENAFADDVDDLIAAEMARQKIPGLALVVVKDGKIVKRKDYGKASIELDTPVGPGSVFKIASLSKPMLAVGILQLVEQGKVGLDDKVSKYFPDAPDTWSSITVRNLLSHTSGIVREAPGFSGLLIQPDADVIKTAYPLPLRFPTGDKYEYCNVGYFMLAEILARVSGKPWPEYMKDSVFIPAGMTSTRTTSNTDLVMGRVSAYALKNGVTENIESLRSLRPSGAFLSTVDDLVAFNAAIDSEKVLKAETRKQMWTAFKLNDGTDAPYGLGWQTGTYRGKKRIGHGGSLSGFRTDLTRFPDEKVTIIVLTNLESANPAAISNGVAALYIKFPAAARQADVD
ncbi:MAG: beta-lactamase family protein [Acidobacteria bacterium]|nr:beta-lactamase family protein [Acidobacteriota bacterium]